MYTQGLNSTDAAATAHSEDPARLGRFQDKVDVEDKVDESEYGKFGWVVDPEGNKVELWEPPAGQ